MRVVKIAAMDVNRYFENLKKGLYDEVKKHQKNLRYEDIQEGFCFEDSYGTLCCLRRCDNQSIFQMEKQYPGMIQILVHKIEPFDEKYRVLYEEKITHTTIRNKLVYAWRARTSQARFTMMEALTTFIDKAQ